MASIFPTNPKYRRVYPIKSPTLYSYDGWNIHMASTLYSTILPSLSPSLHYIPVISPFLMDNQPKNLTYFSLHPHIHYTLHYITSHHITLHYMTLHYPMSPPPSGPKEQHHQPRSRQRRQQTQQQHRWAVPHREAATAQMAATQQGRKGDPTGQHGPWAGQEREMVANSGWGWYRLIIIITVLITVNNTHPLVDNG